MKTLTVILFALLSTVIISCASSQIAQQNDYDGDGVPNIYDKCSTQAGTVENCGCPSESSSTKISYTSSNESEKQDSDGDGVPDIHDKCDMAYGTWENCGCPAPSNDKK